MDEAVFPFNSLVENVSMQRTCNSGIVGVHYKFELLARQAKSLTYMMNSNGPRIEP